MAVLGALPADVECRPIREDDWEGVIDCLRRGFPTRSRDYWARALARQSRRPAVDDLPRYGIALAKAGQVVGVLLSLYTRYQGEGGDEIRCNLSSWSVDTEFRPYATKMIAMVLKRKDVTYVNISPAPSTVKLNKAFGFRLFSLGQFAFLPALNPVQGAWRVLEAGSDIAEMAMLSDAERYMLMEHAELGCLTLICIRDGVAFPLVLMRRRIMHGLVPCFQIVYCRSVAELSQCAGAMGRFLLRRGGLLCDVDATGPVAGLVGHYFANKGQKYFKGPKPPSLGDLTFTELVVFGP